MKKLLIILFAFITTYQATAQLTNWVPYKSKNVLIGLAADSLFYLPVKDTTHTPQRIGAITIRPQDSLLYKGIKTTAGGKHWELFSSGGVGTIPTIDQVLQQDPSFYGTRQIDVNLKTFNITGAASFRVASYYSNDLVADTSGYAATGTGRIQIGMSDNYFLSNYYGLKLKTSGIRNLYFDVDSLGLVARRRNSILALDDSATGKMKWKSPQDYAALISPYLITTTNLQQVTDAGNTTTNTIELGSVDPTLSLKQATSSQQYLLRVGVGTGISSQVFNLYNQSASKHLITGSANRIIIGNPTDAFANSTLYIKGYGANGSNLDVQPDSSVLDEGNIEIMASDYGLGQGIALRQWGNVGAASTVMGYQKKNMGVLDFTNNVNIIRTNTNHSLRFGTNNVERMVLDSNGRLGIGIAAPLKTFHSVGTARFGSLGTASGDTTTNKPVGINSSGDIIPMTYWPGGGGGSTSPGGNSRNIQFNFNGAFSGNDSLKFAAGKLDVTGSIGATNYLGVGIAPDVIEGAALINRDNRFGIGGRVTVKNNTTNWEGNAVSYATKNSSTFSSTYFSSQIITEQLSGGVQDQTMKFLLYGPTGADPGDEIMRIKSNGRVGIGVTVPTARLHLPAGTATAGTAPLKINSGTVLATTEAGAIENDGTHLYYTASNGGTRFQLDQQTGSSSTVTGGSFSTSTNYLTLTQSGAGDVGIRIAPSFIKNTIDIDSTGKQINDSTLRMKAIKLAAADTKVTITPTRNDSVNTFTVGVNEANFAFTPSSTTTLTNKRWTARVGSTTSSATPTINTDNYDIYKLTAQTADITSFTTNLTGTPTDGDVFEVQITGTAARAITWGSAFVSSTVTLPATTVTTATLTVVFQYYTTSSYGNNKWVCANYY